MTDTQMTEATRIRAMLDAGGMTLCDDCLAMRVHTSAHTVAQACQTLADHGDIDREPGKCGQCGQVKLVNSAITATVVPDTGSA